MNKELKLISVVMSVYNSEKTVSQAIDSILNQTYSNIELLIMDDCSDDQTYEILKTYEKKYMFIKVFRNDKNIGLTKSLNSLIKKTKGSFIARQDGDDVSYKDRFEKQLNFIEKYNLDACTTRSKTFPLNKLRPKFSYYLPLRLLIYYKNPFIHGSLMIKREIIINLGLYDERFYYSQDYKLMKDLINYNYKIKIMKEILYLLNTEDNISTQFSKKQKYYSKCVQKNIIPNNIENF